PRSDGACDSHLPSYFLGRRERDVVTQRLGSVGARGLALAVAVMIGSTLSAARASDPPAAAEGCTARAAVAYDATGHRSPSQPPNHPVVCSDETGFGTVETHVAVTRSGAVVQDPAVVTPGLLGTGFVPGAPGPRPQQPTSPAGLAVSQDHGSTWAFVKPAGALWTSTDSALYAD